MAWRVELTTRVLRELDTLYYAINTPESAGAERWFAGLEDTIALLASSPRMGKPTREDPTARELIYGNTPHFYRVIYELDEPTSTVYILSIRHGRRLPPATPPKR